MTPDHEKHATYITDLISTLTYKKYKKGAIEHKSKLWEYPIISLLYEMRNESIDQFVYIQTAIDLYEKELKDQAEVTDLVLSEYKAKHGTHESAKEQS